MTTIRADMVTVMVFRRMGARVEFLQLRRAEAPYAGTWQPIMGGIQTGETAVAAARREMREEAGLGAGSGLLALWSLDAVRPFYMSGPDAVVLSPTFAAEADPAWSPILNNEHTGHRWSDSPDTFTWPGHAEACAEITGWILRPGSVCGDLLRERLD